MATIEEYRQAWSKVTQPRGEGSVVALIRRPETEKREKLERAELSVEEGLVGDRWLQAKPGKEPNPDEQITLMMRPVVEIIGAELEGPGDNIIVDLDLSEEALPAGTRLRLGSAELEVSALPHTGCKKFSERYGLEALMWVNGPEDKALRLRGVNARVTQSGTVKVGDRITVV